MKDNTENKGGMWSELIEILQKEFDADPQSCQVLIENLYDEVKKFSQINFGNAKQKEKIEADKFSLPDRVKFLKEIRDFYAQLDLFERCAEIEKTINFYEMSMVIDTTIPESAWFQNNFLYSTIISIYLDEKFKTKIK